MRLAALTLVTCALVFTAGCDFSDRPIEQTVRGRLLGSDNGSVPARVKILSWSETACDSSGPESAVSQNGAFALNRTAYRGQLGVVVQHDTLCILGEAGWILAWDSGPYGPAPEQLEITCSREAARWSCDAVGDGVEFSGGES